MGKTKASKGLVCKSSILNSCNLQFETILNWMKQIFRIATRSSVRQLREKECERISRVNKMPAVYSTTLVVRSVKVSMNAFQADP